MTHVQERLIAQQVTCPDKDLRNKIAKAKKQYAAKENELQAATPLEGTLPSDGAPRVRGAFVVFQRTQFADDVANTAPSGALPIIGTHYQVIWASQRS